MRKFAPDRRTTGHSVQTVDTGHFKLEMDIFNYTYANYLGVITRSIQASDPTLKLGVTNCMDIEVQFNGLQSSQSFDVTSRGSMLNGTGFGDVFLRTKMNLFGDDAGPAGFTLIPYVKLPSSAPVISNGAVEGGLIAPLTLRPENFIITLMTELDVLKTAHDDGRFVNFVNLVSAGHPIPGLEGRQRMVELFSSVGTGPPAPPIYTFDLGMNFRLDQHTILIVGLNLGLNKAAPKAQVYSGISFALASAFGHSVKRRLQRACQRGIVFEKRAIRQILAIMRDKVERIEDRFERPHDGTTPRTATSRQARAQPPRHRS
jgi:Putative MetA-pathway of phenol degradation